MSYGEGACTIKPIGSAQVRIPQNFIIEGYLVVLLQVRNGERIGDLHDVGCDGSQKSSDHPFLVLGSSEVVVQHREQNHRVYLETTNQRPPQKTKGRQNETVAFPI